MSGKEIQKWADDAMFEAAPIQGDGPQVHLVSATPDPLGAIAAACRMYEGKPTYSLGDVTDDERRHYWEQVKKTHLKAPLEFVDFHFFIEGVTRSFTHQMVRQRTAVYAQESMRFAVKENLADEVSIPPSLESPARDIDRAIWDETIAQIQKAYNYLVGQGVPAEDARGLMPHAVKTRLNYKTNLRNLLDHAGNRLCTQAQFEWRIVFARLVQSIREHVPPDYIGIHPDYWGDKDAEDEHAQEVSWQFKLIADDAVFKPVCYQLGHCPFTADFDRKCSIRERVQRGEFDKIDPREWLLNPAAAR